MSVSFEDKGLAAHMAELRENFNFTHDELHATGSATNSTLPRFANEVEDRVLGEFSRSSIQVDNLTCHLP
jgi:hypothetical protein